MSLQLSSVPLIGMPGIWEWVLIIVAILLLFGATKLPKLGKGLGEGIRNFKDGLKGDDKKEEDGDDSSKEDKKKISS
jgi:sec-independent protein translocase protein TatA